MKILTSKDKKLRKKLERVEVDRRQLKFLFVHLMNLKKLSDKKKQNYIYYLLPRLTKRSSKSKLLKRCLLTYKARTAYKVFKMSRMKLKEMLSLGLIPGCRKAVW
jgi:ribosomal protein S14